jgi:hypothetical protein
VDDWTAEEELLGRKAFDLWRFTEASRAIPWDWADMAGHEKAEWIEMACPDRPVRRPAGGRGVNRPPTARAS